MFGADRRRAGLALFAVLALGPSAGCFQSTAPPGWLPTPEDASHQAFGSWVRIEDRSGNRPAVIEGELIAVDRDTIHVHTSGRLVSLPGASVGSVTLTKFRIEYGSVAMWAALGTLSTASHGFGLILSAPVWMLAGTAATSAASRAPRVQSTDPQTLRPFARFPQGIPPGLDRTTLRPKSWPMAPQPRRQPR